MTRDRQVGYERRMLAQERFIHDKVDAGGAGVDNFFSSFQRKPGWTHASRFLLQTMRGVGYRMELEP